MAIVGKSLTTRILAQASTRQGSHHWLMERVTSVALMPLTLWFIVAAVSLSGAGYDEVRAWLAAPFNTTLMLLLIVAAVLACPARRAGDHRGLCASRDDQARLADGSRTSP